MNFKIGEMEAKRIVKNVFIIGIIYLVIISLSFLSNMLFNILPSIGKLITFNYYMQTIGVVIVSIFALRLACEILYKILKVLEIIIDKNKK